MAGIPYFEFHWSWQELGWFAALLLVTSLGSLAVVCILLVKLPATFFLDGHRRDFWCERPPAMRWCAIISKNLLGLVLILAGMGLSLPGVPGQGLLTILIGIVLLDFPGKRVLERKIVRRPSIFRFINRLRARFHKPPILLDEETSPMRKV